jgi:ParB/RepB/Spo0J family partition protein
MANDLHDPLMGRTVTISPTATTLRGKPLPQAGHEAIIIGKTTNGRQYMLDCQGTLVTIPMSDFAVLPLGDSADPSTTVSELPITAIVPSRTNPRTYYDQDALAALAASIKAQGMAAPILVRKLPGARLQDTFEDHATRHATHEIVAGERRWRAAQIAGLRTVPVFLRTLSDSQALVLQLLENIQRKDLNALEEGQGYQRLVDEQGYTPPTIAEAMHKSLTYVHEALRMPLLCDEAKAAIQQGTLKRSVALLVAQRPTMPLQIEFTHRVLTTGPDNGPLSFRAAKDLAQRSYQTALAQAPFQLTDAELCPKAGACTQCLKRTGASPELWDKSSADVCTDTACFAEKKEAHYERITLQAKQQGRKVITGREAREIMPTDNASPAGYLLLDKPRTDAEAPMRTVLGKAVPQGKVVLIETPSGHMVEAIPTRAAGAALEEQGKQAKPAKGKGTEASREDLEADYQLRWREAAVLATIEGLRVQAPEELDALPAITTYRIMLCLARETDDKSLRAIFGLHKDFDDADLVEAVRNTAEESPRIHNMVLMMLAAAVDIEPLFDRPKDEALQLEALAPIASVDLAAIKARVQEEMKAEAADRAAATNTAAAPPDKAKPTLKPKADKPAKTSKADAQAAIAQALNAEPPTTNDFIEGQHVRVRIDLKNHKGKLLLTKGMLAALISRVGDRAWMLNMLDVDGGNRLIADYTELESLV